MIRTFAAWLVLTVLTQAADLNLVVILDNSGSMQTEMRGGETRIEAAKRSLLTVLQQTPADAQVGVVLLNPPRIGDDWLIPLGPVDVEQTRQAVGSIRAGGPTPLGGAMKRSADALLEARDRQRYGDYKLLLVTDGEATDQALVERYLPEVQARGLLIDAIGVDMGQEHSLASRANTYRNAANPVSLEQAISAVVLGESTYDTSDTGETDFEVLEGFPAEIAAGALSALAGPSNAPIGSAGFKPIGVPQSQSSAPGPPGQPQRAPGGGGIGFSWFVALFFGFIIIRVLTSAVKK